MENYEKPGIEYEGESIQGRACTPGMVAMVAYAAAVWDAAAAINYAVIAIAYLIGGAAFVLIGPTTCWPF